VVPISCTLLKLGDPLCDLLAECDLFRLRSPVCVYTELAFSTDLPPKTGELALQLLQTGTIEELASLPELSSEQGEELTGNIHYPWLWILTLLVLRC
jgi:hypothetical protein